MTSVVFAGRAGPGEMWLVDGQANGYTAPVQRCSLFARWGRNSRVRAACELIGIDEVVCSGSKLITVQNRTVIKLFDVSSFPEPIVLITNTEDVIQCLAISQTFHMLCTVTRDDRLHTFALKDVHRTHTVMMPKPSARRVVITPSWGFIAVDVENEILLFSINAEFLTSYQHECHIAYMTAISSPDDFDFIVAADVKGRLMMFEAYRPDTRVTLVQLVFPICFVDYECQGDRLVVVSSGGKVMLILHPFHLFSSI
jgi:hypothetical protein